MGGWARRQQAKLKVEKNYFLIDIYFTYNKVPYMRKNNLKVKKPRKRKDNSKLGDVFLNCRSCKTIITNDHRSSKDTRYCVDCL